MRVLITGAGGFVGGFLIRYLRVAQPEAQIHATQSPGFSPIRTDGVISHTLELREPDSVQSLLNEVQPDYIYHLAGQAFVPRSFEDPWETLENNIRIQLNLILGCLALNIAPRMLIAGSAEIYGAVRTIPINEDAPLQPSSPYSVSKAAQDLLAYQYTLSHNLPILRARPFNHIGPGQSDRFVAPAFAMQIARIEAGLQPPVMMVGDLSARRDFTDVRDIVRAYHLLIERGDPSVAYNIGSGRSRSIQSLLDALMMLSNVQIDVRLDPARLRPSNIPVLESDITRLRAVTGWQPQIPFEQTLADILDFCRQRTKEQDNG